MMTISHTRWVRIEHWHVVVCIAGFLCCLSSCKVELPPTYQEARQACIEVAISMQKANPGKLMIPSLDCLKGSLIPDSLGYTVDGKFVDHAFYHKKVTLVNFWFESCPPCIAEIPHFNQLMEKFGNADFNYLAVGRETDQDVDLFLAKHPWQFDQLQGGKAIIDSVFKPIWGYPTTLVINDSGIIINVWGGIYEGNYAAIVAEMDSLRRTL